MNVGAQQPFEQIVDQFIELYCETGPGLSIQDDRLFQKFREFWKLATGNANHPALLGQFRVTLTQLGYRSSEGKWPLWCGITLRELGLRPLSQAIQTQPVRLYTYQ